MCGNIFRNSIWYEALKRLAFGRAGANIGRGDVDEWAVDDLGEELERDVGWKLQLFGRGEGKAGTAESDEPAEAHNLKRFAPGMEREEGVHAGDENQIGVRLLPVPGAERVDCVRNAALAKLEVRYGKARFALGGETEHFKALGVGRGWRIFL